MRVYSGGSVQTVIVLLVVGIAIVGFIIGVDEVSGLSCVLV